MCHRISRTWTSHRMCVIESTEFGQAAECVIESADCGQATECVIELVERGQATECVSLNQLNVDRPQNVCHRIS